MPTDIKTLLGILNKFEILFSEVPESVSTYQASLNEINSFVISCAQDEKFRDELANSEHVWRSSKACFEKILLNEKSLSGLSKFEGIHFWYMRSYRAILVLLRNLSVSNQKIPNDLLLQNMIIKTFITIISRETVKFDEMTTTCYINTLTLLHNITKTFIIFDKSVLDQTMALLEYPLHNPNNISEPILFPFILTLINYSQNDDFLYYFFKHEKIGLVLNNLLMQNLILNHSTLFSKLDITNIDESKIELSEVDKIVLKLFKIFACNESFASYLLELEIYSKDLFFKIFKILQIVITNTSTWDKFQLTNIMNWCYKIFIKVSNEIKTYFSNNLQSIEVAKCMHDKISISLDIMSSLVHFEHVQKFLLSYNGLEELISLLEVFQNNLIRINFFKDKDGKLKELKSTNSMGAKIDNSKLLYSRIDYKTNTILPTNFPECKSIIIEILTQLTYNKKEIQDKIRELHGLQLVLSNCVIDDNDPFIKERSIMCIRFLLQENKDNQDFVAKLEAKKVVKDDVLDEAGYDVAINKDGTIGLVNKSSQQN
ncbi:hypothetical protein TBLA_0F04060 [Henningerozyma blattae CBS 6284]|uniref:Ataxin-10 homolog n=1 Tax=Henningerozyma blattae (strain ATCC 34711 / CBS 6284 / DSM 70876 / NBRC 10599 / NRRL Y-10934 / UCD 77-7) TaxID=1071380 RepID=I2H6D7_HENB6|nr:hypothetical protein TBLA_0F04060 [Tetrapisispora blattae CBS 6284]CCH61939.1 hypothetical protein TBLA_0F04060 [Tetrapisispora blattae CBS 6284]